MCEACKPNCFVYFLKRSCGPCLTNPNPTAAAVFNGVSFLAFLLHGVGKKAKAAAAEGKDKAKLKAKAQ